MQKVLIITYYWPPAGGPGVQRWLKFVKYLPDFDIQPIVYTPKNPNYPILDVHLESEVPTGVQVLKQPIHEPYVFASLLSKTKTRSISSGVIPDKKVSRLAKFLLWVRGNFFIPDARKHWVKPSIAYLSNFIEEEQIQTIITTGPPHSLHLIGLGLKQKYDIRWIADFRDPWTSIGYHKKLRLTKSSQKKHKYLEKTVLDTADKLIVTSNTTKAEFEKIANTPIEAITNGFDTVPEVGKLDSKFTISHIGSLLTGRNPMGLWKVLRELVDAHKDFANALQIQLVGVVGEEVKDSIVNSGLADYVDFLGYVSHENVLRLQQQTQILLLLEIDSKETQGIIPGKLFEYFNAGRPILGIGPKDWEAGQMIDATQSGKVFGHTDTEAIKTVLLEWFRQYQNNQLHIRPKHIEKYHRKVLTESLANFIRWESS
ncbi:glycosyltransferase [Flagellimonas meridianipacifica]|uniref:Glycosyltransferase involved in cell wall biosynthesis n=1 Tax=Flagellimonas meridianipacifica TaxID=1080225 RepID=A0A2T0MCA5_9FLAO|nr:glycosyltransferase [Allomuricauda pacifica]PRX55126.1 glycosyltransferase involved in cell wall biosynthesis [Allomuricauda pacifica]